MILSDVDIKNALLRKDLVIDPLSDDTIRENGADLRLGNEIIRIGGDKLFDTHNLDASKFIRETGDAFIINPNEHILVLIKEKIELSPSLIGFVNLRSTYARLGISIPPTIIDAGFSGNLTIGVVGSTIPIKIYSGDRFIHVIFGKTISPSSKPYAGKYANKSHIETAKKTNEL